MPSTLEMKGNRGSAITTRSPARVDIANASSLLDPSNRLSSAWVTTFRESSGRDASSHAQFLRAIIESGT